MDRDTRTAFGLAAAFFILWVVWAQLSPGTYDDDDVTHFFLARESFEEPGYLISLWGRPLFTTVYAIPARIGYGAVEVFTALIAASTLLLGWRLARRLEISPAWVVIPFTAWQPLVFKLGFSSLVEPIGALTLAGALVAFLERRDRTAALLAGLLPLTRFELIVLAPFILFPVWRRRPGMTFVLAALPMVIWNLGGWFFEGDPIWLANQILHNEFGRSFAGARPLQHYLVALPFVTGGALFVPFVMGLVAPWRGGARGTTLVRAMLTTYVVVLSLLAWRAHEFGGSVGYLRHLVAVGPLIGLVAAMGLQRWRSAPTRDASGWIAVGVAVAAAVMVCLTKAYHGVFEHPVNASVEPWMAGAAASSAALVLVLSRRRAWLPVAVAAIAGAATLVSEPPIPLDVERRGVRDVVRFFEANVPSSRTIAVNHPWYFFLTGDSRRDSLRRPRVTQENLAKLAPGSFVVWENHYSHRLAGDVDLEYFAAHPTRYLPRAKDDLPRHTADGTVTSHFVYVIFEVTAPDDPRVRSMGGAPGGAAP